MTKITNNSNTRKLFESRGDKVEGITMLKDKVYSNYPLRCGWHDISGTLVRDFIRTKDLVYQLVPPTVYGYLFCIFAHERLQEIWKNEDK